MREIGGLDPSKIYGRSPPLVQCVIFNVSKPGYSENYTQTSSYRGWMAEWY